MPWSPSPLRPAVPELIEIGRRALARIEDLQSQVSAADFAKLKLSAAPGHVRRRGRSAPGASREHIVIVAFSITPLGVGEGVAEPVARAVKVVRESGLPNHTDAMFTTIEGEWDEVMAVIKNAVDAVAEVAPRVGLVLKADMRSGVTDGMTSKVESLERHLS
jgi:uncharacterized protein (TIGR00106 family)